MKLFVYGFPLLILLMACNKDPFDQKTIKLISFDSKPKGFLELSEFCSSVKYIPLETNSKCNINRISLIKFFGDSIFIVNELFWNMKEILVFDISGKFLGPFGLIGLGPEEIDDPRDIVKFNNSYLIWNRLKIAEFDKQGNFKRKLFNAFIAGDSFFIDSNKINIYHGVEFPGIISQYDFEGNIIKTYKPVNPDQTGSKFSGEKVVMINDEYHLFAPSFDTVWMFSDNRILPEYVFDFKGEMTLQKIFMKYPDKIPPEMAPILSAVHPSSVNSFFESKNYLFLAYNRKGKHYYKLISKKNSHQIDFEYVDNDIDNGIFSTPVSMIDDKLVIALDAIKIMNHRDKFKNTIESDFKNIGDTIKEYDNPVLMICNLDY